MSVDTKTLDRIALEYHANDAIPDIHIENLCQEYLLEWLLARTPSEVRVLELGYGDGIVTAALARHCRRLTLIEGAGSLVRKAAELHPHVQCVHTLFEEFHPAEPFDVVLASHVLEHVDDPNEILRLIAGWLSPEGVILAIVPNRNSIHRQLAVAMGMQPELDTLSKRDHLVGHQRVYSLDGLVAEVEGAGLQVRETAGFFLKVLPNSMMLDYSRELLWALNSISTSLPKELLANIAVVASKTPPLPRAAGSIPP